MIRLACLLLLVTVSHLFAQSPIAEIPRRLPAAGTHELAAEERPSLLAELEQTLRQFEPLRDHPLAADIEIYLKAVQYALEHGEFYKPQDVKKAHAALSTARERIEQIAQAPWTDSRGLVVRGYYSSIDGSPQPFGLEIPAGLDFSQPQPLYVWLHGRGDSVTDLHFIDQRATKPGQVSPNDAIVLHPFGRHCIGFKSAGEIDVLEAIEHVQTQYNVDPRRIVLMGFSMGGAGCWHIGAHYTDRFVAMSPGAGFAETARYQRLTEENYPPDVEQTLWQMYDVPSYVRNLFNLPVIAYSGEMDKQIQAAQVMEGAFAAEGQRLTHLIGPGMGHKYHPDTLAEILRRLKEIRDEGQSEYPTEVHLQTPTLRYNRMHWVRVLGLRQHWRDSRVDALWKSPSQLVVQTSNVTRLELIPQSDTFQIKIDGQTLDILATKPTQVRLSRQDGSWIANAQPSGRGPELAKRPGLQGPIDDAFLEPFLVVLPSGTSSSPAVQRWVEFEQQHMLRRWTSLFRGSARVKRDTEVTPEDIARYHLVCWGTPESNSVLKRAIAELPLNWNGSSLELGSHRLDAALHVPVMIYPNPLNRSRYLVINSGPTFREAHDRTNSLQNPKLPDWALIDVRKDPDGEAPGKIVASDFFDETWGLK